MKYNLTIGHKAGESKPKAPYTAPDSAASISYARMVYGIGEGELRPPEEIRKQIILDGTPIMSSTGELNITGVEIEYRNGTNDQTHLAGFPSVVNERSYSNLELTSASPIVVQIQNTDLDALRVRFAWGKIYRSDPATGDTTGYRIEYAIDLQTDGGGYVEVVRSALDDKASSGYQRSHRIELPEAEESWQLRVRRITPNANSDFIGDKMYLSAVSEVVDSKLRYPNTAVLGLKFDADKFSSIPKLDFRTYGRIIKVPANYDPETRTYATTGTGTTNGVWNGQFKMAYSNNPAWVYYDVLLHKRFALGNRLDETMVDKWAIYNIARYCDEMVPDGKGGLEPRFTCNVCINSKTSAFEFLNQISGIFRGFVHWNGSAIVVNSDQPSDPVYTYTRANVIGEFNYSGTRARDRHSIVSVAFDDPDMDFKTDREPVSDSQAISEIGIRPLEISAFACTSRGQAQRVGRSALLKEQMETRLVTFAVGLDGFIPVTGKIIEIADPLLAGRAIGGRISAVNGSVITVDRDTEIQTGDRFVVNGENGRQESRQVIGVNGREITVATPFTGVSAQNVWAVESEDLQLMKFMVISVSENRSESAEHTFTITAAQHESQIQSSVDNNTYIEQPNYSVIDINTQEAVTELLITSENVINQGIDITNVEISWPQAPKAVKYQLFWRRDNGSWINAPIQYGNTYTIENVYHGVYQAYIIAINAMDVNSKPTYSALVPINSKFAEPPTVATFRMIPKQFGIEAEWQFPAQGAENVAYTEIYISYDNGQTENKHGDYAYPLNRLEMNGIHGNTTVYLKARLVDRKGEAGAWTTWFSATTLADADILLEALEGHIGISSLDALLAADIAAIGGVAEAVEAAELAAATATSAAANAQAAAQAVVGQIQDLNDGFIALRDELRNADQSIITNIEAYKASNDAALSVVANQASSAVTASNSASQQLGVVQSQLTDLNTNMSGLAQAINQTNTNVTNLGGEVSTLAQNIQTLNASAGATADYIQMNETRASQTADSLSSLSQQVQQHTTSLSDLNSDLQANSTAIDSVRTQSNANKDLLETQSQRLTALESGMIVELPMIVGNFDDLNKWEVFDSPAKSEIAKVNDVMARGGSYLTLGNNSGNDFTALLSKQQTAVDPNALYKFSVRYRRTSGDGGIYLGLTGMDADGNYVSRYDEVVPIFHTSIHYTVINKKPANTDWVEEVYYYKGRSLGTSNGSGTIASPTTFANTVVYVKVCAHVNFPAFTGSFDVDYATLEEVTDEVALSTANELLTTRVQQVEGNLTTTSNKTTALESKLNDEAEYLTLQDTRGVNQPPSWYYNNHPRRVVNEFKQASVLGLSGLGEYVNLETRVIWGDSSGGRIVQTAFSHTNIFLTSQRTSSSDTSWNGWSQPLQELHTGLSGKAEASAVSGLQTSVNNLNGQVTSLASSNTQLSTTVGQFSSQIEQAITATNGINASYTVKINNNGYASGFGLISTGAAGAPSTAFMVDADAFVIGKSGNGTKPFVVVTQANQVINGITYPETGVFMNSLYTSNASIKLAHIDVASIGSLNALSANFGVWETRNPTTGTTVKQTGSLYEVRNAAGHLLCRIGEW